MPIEANLDAYLRRINYAGSIAPTLETLTTLHRQHMAAIPFENLDPMMERPVRLQLSDLEQKLVVERRGGYCFEHNLLFKAVLETMDYKVTGLAASVWWNTDPEVDRVPGHMLLLVDIAGVPYIADVGFGGAGFTMPLRLRAEAEQETPHGRFRLSGGHPKWLLESESDGQWRPLYDFTLAPQSFDDYVAMNDVAMAAFRDDLIASRTDATSRHRLYNARLRTTADRQETERTLTTLLELRDVLTSVFGIALPAGDQLDRALEKALRPGARA